MRVRSLVYAILAVAVTACGDESLAPGLYETVAVQTTTTGGDLDLDGYLIFIDGVEASRVGPNGTMPVTGLHRGEHSIELRGLIPNCVVVGENPRSVSVGDALATVMFEVSCTATGVNVITTTIGVDAPHAHSVTVVPDTSVVVQIVGSRRVGRVTPGVHPVLLVPGGDNCSVADPNPVELTIGAGENPEVAFSVTCLALRATIEVTTITSGWDRINRYYPILVDGVRRPWEILRDGFMSIVADAGDHVIQLSGLSANCAASGGTIREVTVSTGGITRDTARAAFDIHCERIWDLALTRERDDGKHVYVVDATGGGALDLGRGRDAEWSADGRAVVFTRPESCTVDYYWYYYDGCTNGGLTVATTEGDAVDITSGATDTGGTWHPDGARIAFTRENRLYVVGREGGDLAQVPLPAGVSAFDPSWSPDGTALAFTCEVEIGNRDVCSVRLDGTAFSRLTVDPAHDATPDWSPDGSTLAFTTSRFPGITEIVLVPSGGGGLVRVSPGTGAAQPAWVDASTLVFVGVHCDAYQGCEALGIFRVAADGSGLAQLTMDADQAPSWRP